jgi:PTH1 family peptidyl-tRNA hydrolase
MAKNRSKIKTMALFQKNPYSDKEIKPLYTLGLNKTILIVGLGNPGKEYDGTRHNIGFACLDEFVNKNDFPNWINKKDLKCQLAGNTLGGTHVIAIKPATFMNLSGEAVQAVVSFYKIPDNQVVVVHDDLDVPFGQIRMRTGGGDAGHNGVKSIIRQIGENFGRIRVGVGPKTPEQIDSADFVLAKFSQEQAEHLPLLVREVNSILNEYVFSGELPHDTRSFI